MAICWYCYWGWPAQVTEIYRRGIHYAGFDAMHYGPGHIVWEDENFDDESIQWCLAQENRYELDPYDFEKVQDSLRELLAVPVHIRCCCPADYDGEHPENYPPDPALNYLSKP
jgi:hypothetical protein